MLLLILRWRSNIIHGVCASLYCLGAGLKPLVLPKQAIKHGSSKRHLSDIGWWLFLLSSSEWLLRYIAVKPAWHIYTIKKLKSFLSRCVRVFLYVVCLLTSEIVHDRSGVNATPQYLLRAVTLNILLPSLFFSMNVKTSSRNHLAPQKVERYIGPSLLTHTLQGMWMITGIVPSSTART